ncbi:MAG: hypothetical protein EOT04_01345 [Candidatus Chaera renei]|uniref:Uncharacterized protein n=1 Tax=Candidatus Chaera renei TaxID=2506947 RepID=A0A4Q0AJ20_9BACT|nr:MAG: hypothetical protein EOT04_01345 [Candidatus Chaera renei]
MIDKETLNLAVRDRLLVWLTVFGSLLALAVVVSSLVQLRPSDVLVPVKYTAYGFTNLYRDKWYYLLSFTGFGLLLLAGHPLLTLKLLKEKGRPYAVAFAAAGLLIGVLALLITLAIFHVVAVSL